MSKKKRKTNFKSKVVKNTEKQKREASSYGYLKLPKGVQLFKEEPGSRVRLDFIPYEVTDPKHPDRDDDEQIAVPGEVWYRRPFKTHRRVGANNETVICPTSIGKPCPICEYRAEQMKKGASYQDEEIKTLKPSARNLYAVIPKDSKDYEEEIHIWDISNFLFQEKLNEELEEDEESANFPSPDSGYTVRIRFTEEQIRKNTFADTSRVDFEERDEQYDPSVIDDVPNLDEVLDIKSYKEVERIFLELSEDDVDEQEEETESGDEQEEKEQEEEEKPKQRKRKKAKKDPEPEEDENQDEEEEKPKPTKKRKKKKEDEPDEEEEKPKKKSKGKKSENKCPHGYTFGVDTDEYDECDDCDVWEQCEEERKKNE